MPQVPDKPPKNVDESKDRVNKGLMERLRLVSILHTDD
jgi:hypothetical protein